MNSDEVKLFAKCINFAAMKHSSQRRLDLEKTPYINHPIGVCFILTEALVTDFEVLMSALLHDTVEDTDTTLEEIEINFGPEIRKIVSEVSDDKTLPKMERKLLQIVHAKSCSEKAKLVKLADKIYNLRDLVRCTPTGWTAERVSEYFVWAKQVTDNMKGLNTKLDDDLSELYRSHGLAM
jgi:guanosine-3',5'-bis(diphosphate) 3'-pyrophosphohydrolase